MLKKDEFFNEVDKTYDDWHSKTLDETRERCEAAIDKKLSELKELAKQGHNFGTLKKEGIQTDEIIIPGKDILENIQSEIRENGYDVEIVQLIPSEQPYCSEFKIRIVIQ